MNLSDLQGDARAQLIAGATTLKVARNEAVYSAGDAADRMYFVQTGRMKIVRSSAAGSEAIVGIRNPGDIFGELSPLQDVRFRSTSAVAIENAVVLALSAAVAIARLGERAELARAFTRGIARRLAEAERELAELAGKSVPGRLVDVLGRLAAEHGTMQDDGSLRIGINLTHKDLADLIGTSRETLTKELSVLADVGLLRVSHKTVTLVQPQAFPFARRREPN